MNTIIMAVPLIAEGLPLHAEALLLQLKALLFPFRDEMGEKCLISIKSLPLREI